MIEAFVKFSSFDKEQQKNYANKNPFHQNQLHYNHEQDFYICPMGQRMNKTTHRKTKSDNGCEKELHVYQAQNCVNCPLRGIQGNRTIKINHRLRYYQQQAREKLQSEEVSGTGKSDAAM